MDTATSEAAAAFRAMADRIERNDGFAGAFLIVWPPGGPEPLEGLHVRARPDVVSFMFALEGELKMAMQEVARGAEGPARIGRR